MTRLLYGVKCAKGKFYTHVEKFGFEIVEIDKQPVGLVDCHVSGPWLLPDQEGYDFYNIWCHSETAKAFTENIDQYDDNGDLLESVDRSLPGLPGNGRERKSDKDPADPKKPLRRNTVGGGQGLQFELYDTITLNSPWNVFA